MTILWTVIIIDCILTLIFVGYIGVPEVNPLMSCMIPYIGVMGMLLIKIAYSYLLLNVIAKPISVKYKFDINKYCFAVSAIYVITFIITIK